jgi:hypothetical protein
MASVNPLHAAVNLKDHAAMAAPIVAHYPSQSLADVVVDAPLVASRENIR